jgi:hypothetical protein
MRWWERLLKDLCSFALVHGKGLEDITRGTYNYSITGIGFPKISRDDITFDSIYISIIALHTSACSCRGVCSNSALHWPLALMWPIPKTITTLHHLHRSTKVDFPLFVNDFHLEMDIVLDQEAFISTLTHSPHLSSDNPSSMVLWAFARLFCPWWFC